MANFVMVFSGGEAGMRATEEERNAVLAAWGKWYEGLGAGVVDGGNPFGSSMSVAPDGTASEGAKSRLTGYAIVKADSLAAATQMTKGCPILSDGGTIEVYETYAVM